MRIICNFLNHQVISATQGEYFNENFLWLFLSLHLFMMMISSFTILLLYSLQGEHFNEYLLFLCISLHYFMTMRWILLRMLLTFCITRSPLLNKVNISMKTFCDFFVFTSLYDDDFLIHDFAVTVVFCKILQQLVLCGGPFTLPAAYFGAFASWS